VRFKMFQYLVSETRERKATIVYATHIFDGLEGFMTNLIHLRSGTIVHSVQDVQLELGKHEMVANLGSPLLSLVLNWLKEDYYLRLLKAGEKKVKRINKWEEMSDNMKQNGDRFYDYWKL
jgi:CCR4-NOT complex subunit CAF16